MSTTKTKKSKSPKNLETQSVEATPPGENQEPAASGKPTKSGSREDSRIVSVAFPSKTARQLRLLSSVTGEPMASIVVSAVAKVIAKRLPDALAQIAQTDADEG